MQYICKCCTVQERMLLDLKGISLGNISLSWWRALCVHMRRGSVVWSLVFLVRSLMANVSQTRGLTKNGSRKDPMKDGERREVTWPRGKPRVPFWSQPDSR